MKNIFRSVIAVLLVAAGLLVANGVAQADELTKFAQEYIKEANVSLKKNPNNYDAYVKRALGYRIIGQYEKAIEDYKMAIQINPRDYMTYEKLAEVYSENLEQYELAIYYYSKAIQIEPNETTLYNSRGMIYGIIGNYDKEIADYNKWIKLEPKSELAYIRRGLAYMSIAKYKRAIKDFDNVIIYLDGSRKELIDNYGRNLSDFMEENLAEAYLYRGSCYFVIGDRKKSIQDYTTAIQGLLNKEKLAQAYYGRGMAYQALGETAKAQSDLAKAKQLASNL